MCFVCWTGNYDQFVKTREEKEEEQEKRYKAEQDQIKHMKQYVAKFGQGAHCSIFGRRGSVPEPLCCAVCR